MSRIAGEAGPDLSVVIPCFNEESNIGPLFGRLAPVLGATGKRYEILLVDDGSADKTVELALGLARADPRIGIVTLSRNFGKEIAITAGLDHAAGRCAIVMDADLQHPPELLPELIAAWEAGFEVVHAAQAIRPEEPLLKRLGVRLFYWLLSRLSDTKLPRGVGDFCLLDRKAIDALRSLPERTRFMKGLYFWIGFRRAQIPYEPAARGAGASRWNLSRLFSLALTGLTAFSEVPLRLVGVAGLAVSAVSIVYALVLVLEVFLHGVDVPGYASLMVGLLFIGGVQLISLGILGEYVGRIFNESKRRPLYLIDRLDPPKPGSGQADP